jgi:predicted ATPase
MFAAHLLSPPSPLSRFVPDIPPVLEQIITRLLAKDPAERYSSAEAVMEVLDAIHVGPKLGSLPVPLTPFIGREVELAELKDRLQDPACRLLTLIGPGGSGKTRLALEATAAQTENYAHGVFFVSLAPLDSVDSIVPTVAEALDFRFYEEGEPQQQLLDYLRQKSMLLILDNFEHLVEGAGLVTEILQASPEVKILATSRARLNVLGEHLFVVGGMSFPDREIQEDAANSAGFARDAIRHSAVRLFLSTVRRVQPRYEPSASDLIDITRICRLVQGMPLGILLAAAWLETLTPAEIASEIGQDFDFLETDFRDVPARQRSLRAVFDHSWKLLTEREQLVFQALSVFRGGFTRQAARQVADVSLRELVALVNKSLLHRASAERYGMHELLRQYAAAKLAQTATVSKSVHDRHCAYYAAVLQQWDEELKGPRQQAILAEMDMEIENARAAWNWAVAQGQVKWLDQAINGLGRFYEWRGRYQEGEAVCRKAAETLSATAFGDELWVLAKILSIQTFFNRKLGRIEFCKQLIQQSLTLLERLESADQKVRLQKGYILDEMAYLVVDSDPEGAKQLYEQSLALFQELGDRWGMAMVLAALGEVAWHLGAYDEAKQSHEESLTIRRALGDQRDVATSLMSLGTIAHRQGQLERAERLVRQSIAIHQEIGYRPGIADGLRCLAGPLLDLGKVAEAHSILTESVAIYNDLGVRDHLAYSKVALGTAKMMLGRYEQARVEGQMGLALSREIGYQQGIGFSYYLLGWLAVAEEANNEAQDLLQESIVAFRAIERPFYLSLALTGLGYAARGLGDLHQAKQHLHEALRTAAEIGAFVPFVLAIPAVALILADEGQKERGVELYALASQYPVIVNSRWIEDIAGRHIAAVAATLPPEVVAAAQKRGQARDLWATVKELLDELGQVSNSIPNPY